MREPVFGVTESGTGPAEGMAGKVMGRNGVEVEGVMRFARGV